MKKKTHSLLVQITVEKGFKPSDVTAYVRDALCNYTEDPLLLLGRQHVKIRQGLNKRIEVAARAIMSDYGMEGEGPDNDARTLEAIAGEMRNKLGLR